MPAVTFAAGSELPVFCRLLRFGWDVKRAMSTVLITGITGYIGSRMAQMMLSEHTVCGLVREPLNRTYLPESLLKELRLFPVHGGSDIQDAIAASQPDIVYHLAAFYTPAHDMNSVDRLV